MANDFLITGEANVSGVTAGIRAIENSVADAKRAITELSRDTGEGASIIKSKMLIAQEAVKSLANEVKVAKLAAKNGLIDENLAEKFKNELDVVQYELKRLSSQYKVIGADIAQENKKIQIEIRNIVREERELYRRKQQDAKAAAVAMSRLQAEAIAEDARRTRLILANARAVERAHGQAIAEDRRRASEAARNSAQIIAARNKELSANNAVLTSLKALAVGFSTQQVYGFVKATIEAAVSMDRIRNSLNAATGSIKEGGEAFDYVRKLAYGLGLDLEVLSKQYGLFIAASNETGLSLKQQRAIFESIAETTRVLGLSNEDMQGSFVALQQIITKGTVQMEELRQQLGDRMPGSLRIMAQALGVNQKALYGLTKEGAVPAKEAIIQFSEAIRKALVDPTLGVALESIQTRFNNLKNITFELKAAFGASFGKALSDNLDITQAKLEETKRTASALGEGLGVGGAYLLEFVDKVYLTARSVGASIQGIVFSLASGVNAIIFSSANAIAGLLDAMNLDESAKKVQTFANSMQQAMVDANDIATESFRMSGEQMKSAFGIGEAGAKKLSDQLDRTRLAHEELDEARAGSDKAMGLNQKSEDGLIHALRTEIEAQRENNAALLRGTDLRKDKVSKMSDEEKGIFKMAEAVWKETEAIEGNILALDRRGVILQEAIRLAEQNGIVTAEAAETIKMKAGEMLDAYERIGEAVPEWLQRIVDKYGAISKAQQAFLDELISAADKAEERLTKASDAARDSSGMKFGEMDLTDISAQIQDAQRQREEAVAELLAATDSAGIKKAQKRVDDAQKDIDDRVRRYKEIEAKIAGQNAEANAPNNEKVEALKKKADELRSEIAALENKQSSGSLSSEELGRLFEAKDALQDIKNEMGDVVGAQEQIHFGWSEISAGTDAAYDAWEKYHALVQKNAIDAKLSMEGQIEAAGDLAASADDIKVSLVKVGNQWVISNKAAKESSVELEKINGHWKVSSESAEDMAENVGLVAEEIKLLAVENRALDEVKPMETAAAATISMEAAMERINAVHLPKMITLMETLRGEAGGVALGGGGIGTAGGDISYQSDVAGQ